MLKVAPPSSPISIKGESIDLGSLEVRKEVPGILNDEVHAFFESMFTVGEM